MMEAQHACSRGYDYEYNSRVSGTKTMRSSSRPIAIVNSGENGNNNNNNNNNSNSTRIYNNSNIHEQQKEKQAQPLPQQYGHEYHHVQPVIHPHHPHLQHRHSEGNQNRGSGRCTVGNASHCSTSSSSSSNRSQRRKSTGTTTSVRSLPMEYLRAPLLGSIPVNESYLYSMPPPMTLEEAQSQVKQQARELSNGGGASQKSLTTMCNNYGSLRESQSVGRFLDGPSSYREKTSGHIRRLQTSALYGVSPGAIVDAEAPPPRQELRQQQSHFPSASTALTIQDRIQARQKQQKQQKQQQQQQQQQHLQHNHPKQGSCNGVSGTQITQTGEQSSKRLTTSSLTAMLEASEKSRSSSNHRNSKAKTTSSLSSSSSSSSLSSSPPFHLPLLLPPTKPSNLTYAPPTPTATTATTGYTYLSDEENDSNHNLYPSNMLSTSLTGLEVLMAASKSKISHQPQGDNTTTDQNTKHLIAALKNGPLLARSNSDPTHMSSPNTKKGSDINNDANTRNIINDDNHNKSSTKPRLASQHSFQHNEQHQQHKDQQSQLTPYSNGPMVLGTLGLPAGSRVAVATVLAPPPGTPNQHNNNAIHTATNQITFDQSLFHPELQQQHRNPDTEEAFHMDME